VHHCNTLHTSLQHTSYALQHTPQNHCNILLNPLQQQQMTTLLRRVSPAGIPFHHCNILFTSLQHTPHITATHSLRFLTSLQHFLLNHCNILLKITATHLLHHCNTVFSSLQHTLKTAATPWYCGSHTLTSLQHTHYITASYSLNSPLKSLQHCDILNARTVDFSLVACKYSTVTY